MSAGGASRPLILSPTRLSVVVTTYNNPRGLQLVLAGLLRQSLRDFELLIADDGSGPETAAIVAAFAARAPFPVRHVWHADEGFRKCTICKRPFWKLAAITSPSSMAIAFQAETASSST